MRLGAAQDAQRGLHAAQQRVQELEDACSAAEEKAGCLEAMLQQHDAKLAEVSSKLSVGDAQTAVCGVQRLNDCRIQACAPA